jgi:hypothetical protein
MTSFMGFDMPERGLRPAPLFEGRTEVAKMKGKRSALARQLARPAPRKVKEHTQESIQVDLCNNQFSGQRCRSRRKEITPQLTVVFLGGLNDRKVAFLEGTLLSSERTLELGSDSDTGRASTDDEELGVSGGGGGGREGPGEGAGNGGGAGREHGDG